MWSSVMMAYSLVASTPISKVSIHVTEPDSIVALMVLEDKELCHEQATIGQEIPQHKI